MTDTMQTDSVQPTGADIVATADNWYRGKMLVTSLVLIVYCGGFFLYDGFIGWPKRNQNIDRLDKERDAATDPAAKAKLTSDMEKLGSRKSSMDMTFQKVIGSISIPLGIWVLVRSLRKSRGEI